MHVHQQYHRDYDCQMRYINNGIISQEHVVIEMSIV